MNKRKLHRRWVLAMAVSGMVVAGVSQTTDSAVINKFIAAQVRVLGGSEYREARKVVTGDLNHDGAPDAAVLYTLEGMGGGNNYVQYLAVFVRTNGVLTPAAHMAVGGKLQREVSLESITDGAILCKTRNYARKDPACCPSKKGTARFALVDGALKEQPQP